MPTPDMLCGKTCQEPCGPTKAQTSTKYSNSCATSKTRPSKFLYLTTASGHPPVWSKPNTSRSGGECWMLNTSELPNDAKGSTLSAILQESVPDRFYLSPKACHSILVRVKNRNKTLPDTLQQALLAQAQLADLG